MKFNRTNMTLTFSAALAGLALTVLTPMAHGHGNNPKNTSDTEPNTNSSPPQPPESNDPPVQAGVDSGPPPVMLDSILYPGTVIGINPNMQDSFDILSRVVSEPVALGMIVNPTEDFAPTIVVDFFDGYGSGSGSITVPMSGVIPAPGTLALLGLAAASAGRRRRRRRL
jgi:hypothetical protein